MKNILLIASLTLSLCMQAQKKQQEVHYIKKEVPVVVKSIVPTSICDSTMVTYTVKEGNAGATVGGGGLGYLVLGPVGAIVGAMAGSSSEQTYTTHTRWDKHYRPGYKIILSDGYSFTTTDTRYKIGQQIKYN